MSDEAVLENEAAEEAAEPDVAGDFAALMAGAAGQVAEEAPYGYTRDRVTGEVRPKKAPGRGGGRKSPSLEELKQAGAGPQEPGQTVAAAPADRPADRAPGRRTRKDRKRDKSAVAAAVPQPKVGFIASGVNKLYRRAGKLIRVIDPEIGAILREMTLKEDEEDVTVGEAWEEVCKTNPRIRRFVLKALAGGAWGQLAAVHAPIVLALLMKDRIRRHIPFAGLVEALLSDDEDGPSDLSRALGGLQPSDVQQMMAMAQQFGFGDLAQMAGRMGAMPRPPQPPADPGDYDDVAEDNVVDLTP